LQSFKFLLLCLYQQLAAVVGPIVNGYIVEWGGGDYNLIFIVTPAFFVLAILCMLGVTQGEAKQATAISQTPITLSMDLYDT
jgi:hypothetical protein